MEYKTMQRKRQLHLLDKLFKDTGGGIFNGKYYDFVLKNNKANLWEDIREEAIAYFKKYNIDWHKDNNNEPKEGPEGHLLSSNISCINHLFHLRLKNDFVSLILKNIDNRIVGAELIDDGYIEFEIMEGINKNPLNEKSKERKRGSKSTSIDAFMVGKKHDGNNILVLLEWKYTETYENQKCKFITKDDYHKNYTDLLKGKDCPIKSPENVKGLFFDPFYQLMRQTLLGWKMSRLNEYNSNEYIHLHVIPNGNVDLRKQCFHWKSFLKDTEKYKIISPDELFKPLLHEKDLKSLMEYLIERYW